MIIAKEKAKKKKDPSYLLFWSIIIRGAVEPPLSRQGSFSNARSPHKF